MENYHNSSSSFDDGLLDHAAELNFLSQEVAMQLLQTYPEEQQNRPTRRVFPRRRQEAFNNLWSLYFCPNPECPEEVFRRRYRMHKHVFLRIVNELSQRYTFFQQRADACGRMGLHHLQKCNSAMRMLAYGCPADIIDEAFRLSEFTINDCLENFTEGVIEIFEKEYLREPNNDDIQRLLSEGAARGFSGMLGSIDCMHWEWLMCPTAWEGQYHRGDHSTSTIILEAVASYDTWIWHAFFGTPGTCNDINVLDRSPLSDSLHNGIAPEVNFTVNDHQYNMGYYLADGIYPMYPTFVKSICHPRLPKDQKFSQLQEFIVGDIDTATGPRDVIVVAMGGSLEKINEFHPAYFALQYPTIYFEGEDGWYLDYSHANINNRTRNDLTLREFMAFRT